MLAGGTGAGSPLIGEQIEETLRDNALRLYGVGG